MNAINKLNADKIRKSIMNIDTGAEVLTGMIQDIVKNQDMLLDMIEDLIEENERLHREIASFKNECVPKEDPVLFRTSEPKEAKRNTLYFKK